MDAIVIELENTLSADDGFFMKLRNLEGFDQVKFDEVIGVLERVKHFYTNGYVVPKYLALLLIDLEPMLWVMCESYREVEREKIIQSAAQLNSAIVGIFEERE